MKDLLPEERIINIIHEIGWGLDFNESVKAYSAMAEAQYDYMIEQGYKSKEEYDEAWGGGYLEGVSTFQTSLKQARADERKRIGEWLEKRKTNSIPLEAGIERLKNGEAL